MNVVGDDFLVCSVTTMCIELMQFRTHPGLSRLLPLLQISQLQLKGCIGISQALLFLLCSCQGCFKLRCHVLHLKPGQAYGDQL